MKKRMQKACAWVLSLALLLSVAMPATWAADAPPSAVSACSVERGWSNTIIKVEFDNEVWVRKITGLTVNDAPYKNESFLSFATGNAYSAGRIVGQTGSTYGIQLIKNFTGTANVVVSATGYEDLRMQLTVNGSICTAQVESGATTATKEAHSITVASTQNGTAQANHQTATEGEVVTITTSAEEGFEVASVSVTGTSVVDVTTDMVGRSYHFTMPDEAVTVTVTMREVPKPADPYHFYVKIKGTFEAAMVGQKNYDGVSGATGSVSSNQNSNVKVYGALIQGEGEPADTDFHELDMFQSQIRINGNKTKIDIKPDTTKGTPETADSGMKGSYMSFSSSLTLSGKPKDAGNYLISITLTDEQGRVATSNALPFHVYTGDETLVSRLVPENLRQMQDKRYMWDIMEPWAIHTFGSNVDGETNSVRVPKDLKAWFGSHISGTYGFLGSDLPWKEVQKGNIPQTLYIPEGCDLTFVNMKILSNVRIVVEKGGKLTLRDSVVQGIIDVQEGGRFSMNYESMSGKFLTGAAICGQLRLADGAILENAAIYSHTNYLANGRLVDRKNAEAVVLAKGNVTVKGQVFIRGDEAGTEIGQTALKVDGTLTLEKDAVLATFGGDGKVLLYPQGGTAVELTQGSTITGDGKLIAIGGAVLWGNGGHAVAGAGTITTKEAFVQGASAHESKRDETIVPGKALTDGASVQSRFRAVQDGTLLPMVANDPLESLYWKTGIKPTPDLTQYPTQEVEEAPEATQEPEDTQAGEVQAPDAPVQNPPEETEAGEPNPAESVENPKKPEVTDTTAPAVPAEPSKGEEHTPVSEPTAPVVPVAPVEAHPVLVSRSMASYEETPEPAVQTLADGSTVRETKHTDGTTTETRTLPNGLVMQTKKDQVGKASAIAIDLTKVKTDAPVSLPVVAGVDTPAMNITAQKNTKIFIPIDKPTSGIVAVQIKGDGTRKIDLASNMTEQGLAMTVQGNTKVQIADYSKFFRDVQAIRHWATDAINAVTSRQLMQGTGAEVFMPDALMTRAMMMTVLARMAGENTEGGTTWHEKGVQWAMRNGISSKQPLHEAIELQELVQMLYTFVKKPAVETAVLGAVAVDPEYQNAMAWAVANHLVDVRTLKPTQTVTRAKATQMVEQACKTL